VQALLDEDQGQIQGLEGQGQEEEVLQEADGHIPDLIQNQICDQEMAGEVVQDRREGHAQSHIYKIGDPDLYQGQGEKDLDQDLARTQEEGVGDQDQETEIEVRVKPDLDQSQNQ